MNEFDETEVYKPPILRRGMTSVEAFAYLRAELPDVPIWTCWRPSTNALCSIIRDAAQTEGRVGEWHWRRADSRHPDIFYYMGPDRRGDKLRDWVGLLEVKGPSGASFLLFSYLDCKYVSGDSFFVSTSDTALLDRFAMDLRRHSHEHTDDIVIEVDDGPNLRLPAESNEWMVLPSGMQDDIQSQVFSFFCQKDLYAKVGVPYRRGLLFAGPPGCGKTMMARRLVRQCHQRFKARAFSIRVCKYSDEDSLACTFKRARDASPSLVILDDMESLVRETRITRAAFLAQLDGINSPEGMLIIGTTNNPGDIDPALVHRPSRFDRVWHFRAPDLGLRTEYLRHALADGEPELLDEIARGTSGWSFAYLNELRVTAAVLGLARGLPGSGAACLRNAFELLSEQFKAGEKGHIEATSGSSSVGFGTALA